jgi:drug/metabolite transporter (DMT)-like permease
VLGATTGVLQALGAVVLWGASFGATKRLLVELSPATILLARSLMGAALVGVGLAARGRVRVLPARDWRPLVVLALLGLVATQLLQAWALERSTSAKTAWLVAVNPIVTAVLAAVLIGEDLRRTRVGLALAFAGTVLVVTDGMPLGDALALPATRGDLLTLASTVAWALYTIRGRGFVGRHPAPLVTGHLLGIAVLVFAPAFVASGGPAELAALSAGGWLCLAYLGVACSGIAFLLYYAALAHLEASQVAAFIYVEPLVAQALGIAVLGEPPSVPVALGGAAILTGVWRVSRAGRPAPERAAAAQEVARVGEE